MLGIFRLLRWALRNTIMSRLLLVVLTLLLFYHIYVPRIIENRMKDLNLVQYTTKEDGFVPKVPIIMTSDDLYYLKHGKLNN